MTTLIQTLTALRDTSALLWEACVEHTPKAASSRDEALESWTSAMTALRAGKVQAAADELDVARRRANGWGDDAPERKALHALSTFEAVLPDRIAQLRSEAVAARDVAQVSLCDAAFAGDETARAKCVRVILDSEAQEGAL